MTREVAATASPERPLVYLLTTSRGGLALVVPAGSEAPAPEHAVWLAGGDRLSLRDLLDGNLDFSSQRLAVLSACQTGITEFERVPDEVIGLPAGFLQAGVPGVVATLWPVNDRSTVVLMAEFYADWFERCYDNSGGTDVAAYEAATDLRSRPDPENQPYADPAYWAGFVSSGP